MVATKICRVCGRSFEFRPSMRRVWKDVQTCSKGCRRAGIRPVDRALEEAIERLLDQRERGATICPSEAARLVRPADWRPLLERARRAARRLVHAGRVEITQRGRVVDPSRVRGPIRVRRVS